MGEDQRVVAVETIATLEDAFDNPEAHIPGDRRRALATGIPMSDRVHGAALFADIWRLHAADRSAGASPDCVRDING
ncbi:MAG: hypothetical protein H0T80_04505 [Betaproteobacteria bacterium]|nr:hypothetical protein [Betaproteobacteria bacterium]